jgi:hypothetical protein
VGARVILCSIITDPMRAARSTQTSRVGPAVRDERHAACPRHAHYP